MCARLRTADQDAAAGTVEELARIVGQIRAAWPQVRIFLRGDSGFCREEIMASCESNRVDYVLGLVKNNRLNRAIEADMGQAKERYEATQKASPGVQGLSLPDPRELVV